MCSFSYLSSSLPFSCFDVFKYRESFPHLLSALRPQALPPPDSHPSPGPSPILPLVLPPQRLLVGNLAHVQFSSVCLIPYPTSFSRTTVQGGGKPHQSKRVPSFKHFQNHSLPHMESQIFLKSSLLAPTLTLSSLSYITLKVWSVLLSYSLPPNCYLYLGSVFAFCSTGLRSTRQWPPQLCQHIQCQICTSCWHDALPLMADNMNPKRKAMPHDQRKSG